MKALLRACPSEGGRRYGERTRENVIARSFEPKAKEGRSNLFGSVIARRYDEAISLR
jgi:hypothetical protein